MDEQEQICPDCGFRGTDAFSFHDCKFVLRQRIATIEAELQAVLDAPTALSSLIAFLAETAERGYDPFAAEPLVDAARAALAKAGVK